MKEEYTPAFSSGLVSKSATLELGPGKLLQLFLYSDGENDAELKIYDDVDYTKCDNNKVLVRVLVPASSQMETISLAEPLHFFSGLSAVLTTEGTGSYILVYQVLAKKEEPKENENQRSDEKRD